MYKDKQLVRITMFVLLVGIVLVYAVFFNVQGDSLSAGAMHFIQKITSEKQDTAGDEETNSGGVAHVSGLQDFSGNEQPVEVTTGSSLSFSGLDALFGNNQEYLGTGIQMLPDTSLFQGNIDILKTLGINYEYVLKDGKYNIYYAFIGRNKTYNLPDIAKEFGGKTIEIISQKDIVNNLYFGDRVTFIELPQYKDVKVNVFIQYGNALWMIQDDASQYRAHKKYIRQLFTGK